VSVGFFNFNLIISVVFTNQEVPVLVPLISALYFGNLMRYWLLIFILLPINAQADQSDFSFYDTGGTHKYAISNISAQLSSQYGFKVRPFAIVVASEKKSQLYRKQFEYLNRLDAENLSLIYISALSDKVDTHGYHTDESVADKILDGRNFIAVIYTPEGVMLFSSENVLTDKEIENIVKKHNKANAADAKDSAAD